MLTSSLHSDNLQTTAACWDVDNVRSRIYGVAHLHLSFKRERIGSSEAVKEQMEDIPSRPALRILH